ncbi:MFS transporter [Sphingomonas profundi]|uniref:MFS transporter n=1 Tax=Alterirhizorhabdus profundi TaxID=2681549 RepID=UPI0012E93953|nr:MFS transporter [Sphingomonas profundi]
MPPVLPHRPVDAFGPAIADPARRGEFRLLFAVMLAIAAGNTALQSVLPAIGRSLGLADAVIAITFSFSALVWSIAAPWWARRSDRTGSKRMVAIGIAGFTVSLLGCAMALTAGLQGWLSGIGALVAFVLARLVYGFFGAAAPPAAQAMVARRTSRAERTNALTLLASAFGLGTILGPALAPFFVLPVVGLAGPGYVFAIGGILMTAGVLYGLPRDRPEDRPMRGAANAEPSIGGEPSGASVIAASRAPRAGRLRLRDPRIWPWMLAGLVAGHAQAMVGQTMAFLTMDRLHLTPDLAQPIIGIVLMSGAGAALLVQWGLIPRLGWPPRLMLVWGSLAAAAGCVAIALAASMHALAVSFAIASLGFGFVRPGFTAGASLAVGSEEQGLVAGRVTSVNGIVFVLGPSLGVGLYGVDAHLPYLAAAGALAMVAVYCWRRLPG